MRAAAVRSSGIVRDREGPCSRQEDFADLVAIHVQRGHDDVRGLVVAELEDEFGEVGLERGDAGGLERGVEPDLGRGHGLDLDDLGSAAVLLLGGDASFARRRRSGVPFGGVAPSGRCRRRACSCAQTARDRRRDLPACVRGWLTARRSCCQSVFSPTTWSRLAWMTSVAWADVVAKLGVLEEFDARLWERVALCAGRALGAQGCVRPLRMSEAAHAHAPQCWRGSPAR